MRKISVISIYRLIILFILSISCSELIAQEISYYDKDWNPSTEDKAQYYFVTIDNYPKYRLNTLVKYQKKIEKHKRNFSRKIIKEIGTKDIHEINFPDSDYDSIYIGRKVKMFSAGDIYTYLCKSSNDSVDWPSREIKNKSGICYEEWKDIEDGTIGRIVWKFNNFKSSTNETVFLLQINDYYIPVCGSGLTLIDKYSRNNIPRIKESFFYRLFHKKIKPIGQI